MTDPATATLILGPGEGRHYPMGRLRATFKADEAETGCRYAVSEWRLDPGQTGVGAHSHAASDELFWVLDGTPSILAGDTWHTCPPGSFLRIPAGVLHDFRNDTGAPATLLNVFLPGGFERDMPAIAAWFAANPG